MVIRDLTPGDLPALHAIRAAAFAPIFAGFRAALGADLSATALAGAEGEQAAHLDALAATGRVLVAWVGAAEVGFCAWTPDPATGLGEIGLYAVHPDHQRRGIARALLAAALDRLRAAGMRAAVVGTGGDAAHAPARAAYAAPGFGPGLPSVHLYRRL